MAQVLPTDTQFNKPDVAVKLLTAETTSDEFVVPEGGHATIFCGELAGSEEVHLLMKKNDGSFVEVTDSGNYPLTATANASGLVAKGVYQVKKDVTAAPASVEIYGVSFKRKGY